MAAQERVPPNIIQSIVGHADPEITRIYIDHFTAEQKQAATAGLPDYLGIAARYDGAGVPKECASPAARLAAARALLESAGSLTPREQQVLAILSV